VKVRHALYWLSFGAFVATMTSVFVTAVTRLNNAAAGILFLASYTFLLLSQYPNGG
jgi:hypothetical protein